MSGSDRRFTPPPYPHDRLLPLRAAGERHPDGLVDLSVGTPCDDPPTAVLASLVDPIAARGYPASVGSTVFRNAARDWLAAFLGVEVAPNDEIGACVGTKELVVGLPHWLRLDRPTRDTVLYPALSYPSYAMGATLAGCRAVPVPAGANGPDLATIDPDDIGRALCLWVNSPGNPDGSLVDLTAIVEWGRANDVLVVNDECYVAFTWEMPHGANPAGGPGRSVLEWGTDGVLAVHSLSKRSNLAGLRAGFYAGDAALVAFLGEVRKHAGLMTPGPVQSAAAIALGDEAHVDLQRARYAHRLEIMSAALSSAGLPTERPGGGFYLWVEAPDGDGWALTEELVERAGVLGSPGGFYGPGGSGHVRLAMVQPDEMIERAAERLSTFGRR